MSQKYRFEAIAHKSGKWWAVRIHELDQVTRASRTKDIQSRATDVVATALNVDPDQVTVHVTLRAPGEIMERWTQARGDLEEARKLASKGARESRAVIAELSKGFTSPEIARMLGISTQRVSQLKVEK